LSYSFLCPPQFRFFKAESTTRTRFIPARFKTLDECSQRQGKGSISANTYIAGLLIADCSLAHPLNRSIPNRRLDHG
jgi:hypothetical protein